MKFKYFVVEGFKIQSLLMKGSSIYLCHRYNNKLVKERLFWTRRKDELKLTFLYLQTILAGMWKTDNKKFTETSNELKLNE